MSTQDIPLVHDTLVSFEGFAVHGVATAQHNSSDTDGQVPGVYAPAQTQLAVPLGESYSPAAPAQGPEEPTGKKANSSPYPDSSRNQPPPRSHWTATFNNPNFALSHLSRKQDKNYF